MKKRYQALVGCVAVISLWAVGSRLQGQPAASAPEATRVGVVNLVSVFNSFQQTEVLNQKMDQRRAEIEREAKQREQSLKGMEQKLMGLAPNSAAYAKENEAYLRARLEFQLWQGLQQESLLRTHKLWIQRTYDMVTEEVGNVAKKHGLHMVLTKEDLETDSKDTQTLLRQIFSRKVVYSDSRIEITDEVLRNLNVAFEKAGGAESVKFD